MKTTKPKTSLRRAGGAKIVLLVALVFLVGLGAGAFWVYRIYHPAAATPQGSGLTPATRAILQGLATPVEVRFYSILDPASVSEPLKSFAGRVDQFLSRYEQDGGSKLKVTRFTSQDNADAASADGARPFNIDKGNACYLGITVAGVGGKESFPLLSPDWEQAFEPDLSRAIARVQTPRAAPGKAAPVEVKISPVAIEQVKQAIPNLAATSLEDGTRLLRDAGVDEFKAATVEMQAQLKAAQDKVVEAQASGSEPDKLAALKNLQQVQIDQAERLKQIAAKAKAQVEAFRQLKAASR